MDTELFTELFVELCILVVVVFKWHRACISLAGTGFSYSGVDDTVFCCVCGRHCTARNHDLQHRCSEFSFFLPVLGAADGSIPIEQQSSVLHVPHMISIGTFGTSCGIVFGALADMGLHATEDITRGGVTSAVNVIGGALGSMGTLCRIATFRWLDTANVNPLRLAKNGFFYSREEDLIICCACGMHCTVGDNPLQQHRLKSPRCSYVLGADIDNSPPGELAFPIGTGTLMYHSPQTESVHDDPVETLRGVYRSAFTRASRNGIFSATTYRRRWHKHKEVKVLVVELRYNISKCLLSDVVNHHLLPAHMLEPNPSSSGIGTARDQMEDHGQISGETVAAEQPQGVLVDAMMDREEIQIVLGIMENFGFNINQLATLVAERLSRGEDCLIPAVLLEAVFNKFA